ncbi:MAG: hypothetical protein ACRCWI_08555 [Brevinema sp.]
MKPLSYYTNRISIFFICIFFVLSCVLVFFQREHRALIISLFLATSGAVCLFIITIASPNHQIDWISKLLDRRNS